MTEIVFLYVTAPDEPTARKIGATLIEEDLAACVNILGRIQSLYKWEGEIRDDEETAMIVKTAAPEAARDKILEIHPYETPAVAALSVSPGGSAPAFLDWIARTTAPSTKA